MANRKRPLDSAFAAKNSFQTPEKRVSGVRLPDLDYMHWGVEETCQYLCKEGLEEWETIFKGMLFNLCGASSPNSLTFSYELISVLSALGPLYERFCVVSAN